MAVVKINAVRVPPERHAEFERRFIGRAGVIDDAPGFLGFELLRPTAGEDRYFIVTRWKDDDSFIAWLDDEDRAATERAEATALLGTADVLEFQVVVDKSRGR